MFASRAYINALAEIYSDNGNVSLLCPVSDVHPVEGIDSRVTILPVYNKASKLKKFFNLIVGRVNWFYKELPELLNREHFDLIVFDNSRASFRMIDLAHHYGSKVITIHHNCELEFNRDNASGLIKPILMYWTKKYEREAVNKSDLNFAISEEDRCLLKNYHVMSGENAKIEVLGVFESVDRDYEEYHKSKAKSVDGRDFVITGSLSYIVTLKSLYPWLDKYFPILKEVIPDAQLTIAGKNPPQHLVDKCRQLGISLIPSPPDMTPILQHANCYICPTQHGGGLKLRVMDGLKTGLPVITHSVSARGYGMMQDSGVLMSYDSLESFREACEKYIKHKWNSDEIIENYLSVFSFKSGKERMKSFLDGYGFNNNNNKIKR